MEIINFLNPIQGNATKTFCFQDNKWKEEASYKAGIWHKAVSIEMSNLKDFFKVLEKEATSFFVHGKFKDGIDLSKPIPRRKKQHADGLPITIEDRKIRLFCLDVDGYDTNISTVPQIQIVNFIRNELPLQFNDADYIYQLSASYKLTTKKLKCHLFFWLKEAIENTQIKKWVIQYNKENGRAQIIDDSVYTCHHPIFIQKRICLGAEDPVKKFIGYINKNSVLDFNFPIIEKEKKTTSIPKKNRFDLVEGVKKILTSNNYHNTINSLALSFINNKIPPETVKKMIKGAMEANNDNSERWQIRYDDIDRSVDSAVEIVDCPTFATAENWINEHSVSTIKDGFTKIALKLSPLDIRNFIGAVNAKTGAGIANLNALLKTSQIEQKKIDEEQINKKRTKKREMIGIHEVEVTLSNSEEVYEKVCSVFGKSEKKAQVFRVSGSLASVGEDFPKTIRQVSKLYDLGADYPKIPIIRRYFPPYFSLAARLEKDIAFLNAKGKNIVCPKNILGMIAEGVHSSFLPLTGIIEHPFVNDHFEIVQKNGYNKQTGLFSILHHKLKLSLKDPSMAYDYLANVVFDEFPFSTDLDRAVAVAALVSCVQRPVTASDDGNPGFGIVSPTHSSGKTTLAQLISYSIYNRAVAATNFSHDEEELSKHLLAILREGHSCVLFDNIPQNSEVKSEVLAKAMSTDVLGGRALGENRTIEVPSSVIWLFTGNGITFVGDFATRIYPIHINPDIENPDQRQFKRTDLGQWAIDNRKHIISAIISLVMGAKDSVKMKGSSRFKLWDRFVRQPIFQASKIDVNQAIKENKKSDSTLRAKEFLLIKIYEKFGKEEFRTKDLIKHSFDGEITDAGELLEEILGIKKAQNSRSVGRFLSKLVNVVLGEYTLTEIKTGTVALWRIKKR